MSETLNGKLKQKLSGVINMKNQEGAALMIGLMIILVLVPIGIAVSNNIITGIKATSQIEEQTRALNVAEAGFEIVMYDVMDKLNTVNTTSGSIHSIPDIANLPAVDNGTWSSYKKNLGFDRGGYRYKLEEYQSGPNNGLIKVSIQGKYKDITKHIAASVYPGGNITDIIDRYRLHLVANEINYPWLERYDKCAGWKFNKLIKMRNMVDLFDFNAFKQAAKNASDGYRYFEDLADEYNNNNWAGENVFQRMYSSNGAGSPWKKDKDIENEGYFSWEDELGKTPIKPKGNSTLPGGVFYLDPDDQGFRLELGNGKLTGPKDDPTVIVVEGDMEIADYASNMSQIENVYFVVKGQVEFSNYNGWQKTNKPGNIKTKNSFIYTGKYFKWTVTDPDTGARKPAPPETDSNEGIGSISDNKAAVSGYLNNNKWNGPILTSGNVDIKGKDNQSGKPMYDGQSMQWEALEDGLNNQSKTIYPKVISWQEK